VIVPLRTDLNLLIMRTTHVLFTLAMPLLVAAQNTLPDRQLRSRYTPTHTPAPAEARTDHDPLWQEDFENGLGDWVVATSQGNVDWRLTNTGNSAGFTPGPLESTTGFPSGSWILADSDAGGTEGQGENTTITSPAILGFDTVEYMLLRFEQSFRQLNDDQTLVEVSGNGGLDWMEFPVNTNIGGNQSTPGSPVSEVVVLNVSGALANGSADIRVRFRWISDQGFTYSWQVDDIALLPVSNNDLVISNAVHAVWDYDEPNYRDLPCTIYLEGEQRQLHFRATIGNNGSITQTNAHLQVEISSPGGNSQVFNSTAQTLEPGGSATFDITDYQLPAEVGPYNLHMAAVQTQTEDVPSDNAADITIRVDPFVFARDEGVMKTQRDNNGEDYEIGNRFLIEEAGRVLHAVDVALGPNTDVGALITVSVYNQNLELMGESDFHTIAANEIGALGEGLFTTIPLMEPLELIHDRVYLVCLHAYLSGDEVWTGISGSSPEQTSLIYRYDANDWFFTTTTPMVRMNFSPTVAVGELEAHTSTLSAFPSVFDDHTLVDISSTSGTPSHWELRDASGRSVNGGTLQPHSTQVRVEGGVLAEGIYLFTLFTDLGPATLRLVHQARR
jgi:hypothetical protein